MKIPGKWIDELCPQTAISAAAGRILKLRIGAVGALLPTKPGKAGCSAKAVHELRVAARRAEAALRLFRPWIEQGSGGDPVCAKMRRRLRDIRRAAGIMRDCDIHAEVFREIRERASGVQIVVIDHLIARTRRDRARAQVTLLDLADAVHPGRLARWRRRAVAAVEAAAHKLRPEPTLLDAARASVPPAVERVRAAAVLDLTELANLHSLRIHLKRLRYKLELLGPALGARFVAELYPQFQSLQDRLGDVNDGDTVLATLDAESQRLERQGRDPARHPPGLAAGVSLLRQRCAGVRDKRVEAFLAWWAGFDFNGLLGSLEAAIAMVAPDPQATVRPPTDHDPVGSNGAAGHSPRAPAGGNGSLAPDAPRRLAAIDVGSNSTRLVIAEAHPDGTYRVIDDEKELSRLAGGLVKTGKLDAAAMDRAATIVARLRAIAEGYNCTMIRAIGTAAVREATNGPEFVELVRARAGVDLRIISADEEARLAYLSAHHAFGDMQTLAAGVVDIGGGSTEIVLSSRGVVDEVYTLPIGAVGLTERFGGPEHAAGDRFKAMRRWLKEQLRRRIPAPMLRPELVVGTGGTITTLASIAIKRDRSAQGAGGGAAPATVRGYQLRRTEVRRILDDLRDCSLEERTRVPGLSAERADIIVAGVSIIRAVMRHLGARRLRVHDLGVREGLLLTMIREIFPRSAGRAGGPGATGRPARLNAARRFARACRYEEAHSERVAALSLQIFDALAPLLPRPQTLWSEPVARELLEAGAVLHDVGYIINYAGHHKHGYHLIVHSDLSGENGGFSRREVEIVANLARFHRRATPKDTHASLRALASDDRTLVRCLAAILRIADGLDRTHSQNVKGVKLRLTADAAIFELDAIHDPATDAWGASRKCDLFREVFGLEPAFEWSGRPLTEPKLQVPQPALAAEV